MSGEAELTATTTACGETSFVCFFFFGLGMQENVLADNSLRVLL